VKRFAAVIALVALLAGLNALVWQRDIFTLFVGLPILVALVAGGVWAVLAVRAEVGRHSLQGRAAGGLNAVAASVLFFAICVVVYAFASALPIDLDLTKEGRRDLAPQTVQVLQTMGSEVRVTCFFLESDDELLVIAREKTLRFLEQCARETDLLKISEEDPQIAVAKMQELGLTRTSPQGTVVIQAGGKMRVLPLSGASPRLEERDFTNALISVLRDAEPKLYFLTGNGERRIEDKANPTGAGLLADFLARESYRVESLGIKITDPEIPADCDALVIINPTGDLNVREVAAIDDYIKRGGRLFLLLDPWIRVTTANNQGEQLRPWLERTAGISVGSDIVITDQRDNPFQLELTSDAQPFADIEKPGGTFSGSFAGGHPITRGFDQPMLLRASRTVTPLPKAPEKTTVVPLLRTTHEYWAEGDVAGLRESGSARRDPAEPEGPLMIAAAATIETETRIEGAGRNREARILVVGDSDLTSNDQVTVPGNLNFLLNAAAWLTESEQLIAIRPSGKDDPPILLSPGQQRAVLWFSTLFTAQVALGAGVMVWFFRRRNQ